MPIVSAISFSAAPSIRKSSVCRTGGLYHSLYLIAQQAPLRPQVIGTWPAGGSAERAVMRIVVAFDWPVVNVSADDLSLSVGSVVSVQGSGRGPYVFEVAGIPDGLVTATIHGDIVGLEAGLAECTWTLTNALPPVVPYVLGPGDGGTNTSVGAPLSWGSGAGLTYDVYLDTVNPPGQKVASGLTDTTFTPDSLQPGTRYYWRVVATGPGGQTEGPVWSFATHIQGDANGDGCVNAEDLQRLVLSWGAGCVDGPPYDPQVDFNGDGFVNVGDLQLLVANWGKRL